jgi:hypothetical protein
VGSLIKVIEENGFCGLSGLFGCLTYPQIAVTELHAERIVVHRLYYRPIAAYRFRHLTDITQMVFVIVQE